MVRAVLIVFILVLTATTAFSQPIPQSSSANPNKTTGEFRPVTLHGCLSRSGDRYSLTVSATVPHQYRLVGSNLTQLDGKVGHTVSIIGTIPDSSLSYGTNTNAESDTVNFLSVEDVASTCAAGDTETLPLTPFSRAAAELPTIAPR
jgi:hypothetical protein